ncbi:glycosyltransferase [Natrinema sp. LN54]|uniref:glycosyltransferase n=1 Tax=Natrinema sp. LN54 TaxID=3458705 RepID=UPI00403516AD
MSQLQNDGYDIELQVVEGNHDTVIEQLQTADIVVDQLRLGTFGVVALEAMAAGTPVICYIRDDLRERYPGSLPIVNATPESIESVLRRLVSDSERRLELSADGRDYVEEYHSLPVVGERLVELYSSLGAN